MGGAVAIGVNPTANVVDTLDVTFGVRRVHFDAATGFYLNDVSMKILGTANHQDAAAVGVAVPDHLQEWRINKLREMVRLRVHTLTHKTRKHTNTHKHTNTQTQTQTHKHTNTHEHIHPLMHARVSLSHFVLVTRLYTRCTNYPAAWSYVARTVDWVLQGVNGWRTAHNPPNPALLDATDRIGMLVWDETHRNGNLPELELLIRRDRNHPRY